MGIEAKMYSTNNNSKTTYEVSLYFAKRLQNAKLNGQNITFKAPFTHSIALTDLSKKVSEFCNAKSPEENQEIMLETSLRLSLSFWQFKKDSKSDQISIIAYKTIEDLEKKLLTIDQQMPQTITPECLFKCLKIIHRIHGVQISIPELKGRISFISMERNFQKKLQSYYVIYNQQQALANRSSKTGIQLPQVAKNLISWLPRKSNKDDLKQHTVQTPLLESLGLNWFEITDPNDNSPLQETFKSHVWKQKLTIAFLVLIEYENKSFSGVPIEQLDKGYSPIICIQEIIDFIQGFIDILKQKSAMITEHNKEKISYLNSNQIKIFEDLQNGLRDLQNRLKYGLTIAFKRRSLRGGFQSLEGKKQLASQMTSNAAKQSLEKLQDKIKEQFTLDNVALEQILIIFMCGLHPKQGFAFSAGYDADINETDADINEAGHAIIFEIERQENMLFKLFMISTGEGAKPNEVAQSFSDLTLEQLSSQKFCEIIFNSKNSYKNTQAIVNALKENLGLVNRGPANKQKLESACNHKIEPLNFLLQQYGTCAITPVFAWLKLHLECSHPGFFDELKLVFIQKTLNDLKDIKKNHDLIVKEITDSMVKIEDSNRNDTKTKEKADLSRFLAKLGAIDQFISGAENILKPKNGIKIVT